MTPTGYVKRSSNAYRVGYAEGRDDLARRLLADDAVQQAWLVSRFSLGMTERMLKVALRTALGLALGEPPQGDQK